MDEILVNGKTRTVPRGSTLQGLLSELQLDPRWVIAELNGEALSRSQFESTMLSAGDRVELVRPVAGG